MHQLVDRFSQQVYAFCVRMLGHCQDAEDAVQDTFVRVFRSLKNWDSSRQFEPWLMAIAGNRCRTRAASRQKRQALVSLSDDLSHCASHRRESNSPLKEELELAIRQLPSPLQEVFLCFHQDQMSYAAIAAAMNIPEGTAKTWVRRARLQILGMLKSRGVLENTLV